MPGYSVSAPDVAESVNGRRLSKMANSAICLTDFHLRSPVNIWLKSRNSNGPGGTFFDK